MRARLPSPASQRASRFEPTETDVGLVAAVYDPTGGAAPQVHEYERWTPKDVVQLDPSTQVSLLVRWVISLPVGGESSGVLEWT